MYEFVMFLLLYSNFTVGSYYKLYISTRRQARTCECSRDRDMQLLTSGIRLQTRVPDSHRYKTLDNVTSSPIWKSEKLSGQTAIPSRATNTFNNTAKKGINWYYTLLNYLTNVNPDNLEHIKGEYGMGLAA